MAPNSTTIEISQPQQFKMGAVVTVTAYGLLLVAPIFVSMLVVSVMPFSMLTALIPLFVLAASAFFLPFGMGNTHITRLVRSFNALAGKGEEGFVVQLTLSPRLRTGLRATLEDADDIGWLTFTSTGLLFAGDSVKLSVPYDQIQRVQPRNIGLRGRFVYGRRINVVVANQPEEVSLEFAERSSWLLPASRRITRELTQRLSSKVSPRSPAAAAGGISP
jgi:hypothetical protein